MHGSSSVPQDLLAEIREFGGDMKETYGVPVEEIQEGIRHGVRKVNIDTDIRLAMTGAIRSYFAENPSKFDPRDYLKPAMAGREGDLQASATSSSAAPAWRRRSSRCRSKDGGPLQERRAAADRELAATLETDSSTVSSKIRAPNPNGCRRPSAAARALEKRTFADFTVRTTPAGRAFLTVRQIHLMDQSVRTREQ